MSELEEKIKQLAINHKMRMCNEDGILVLKDPDEFLGYESKALIKVFSNIIVELMDRVAELEEKIELLQEAERLKNG